MAFPAGEKALSSFFGAEEDPEAGQACGVCKEGDPSVHGQSGIPGCAGGLQLRTESLRPTSAQRGLEGGSLLILL
jgi:hypothetical protein